MVYKARWIRSSLSSLNLEAMVKLTLFLTFVALAASGVCSPTKRTVPEVKNDFVVIGTDLKQLKTDTQSLTAQNAISALAKIQATGQIVAAAIGQAAGHIKGTPVTSASDSAALAKAASDTAVLVADALGTLSSKKAIVKGAGPAAVKSTCTQLTFFGQIAGPTVSLLVPVLQNDNDKAVVKAAAAAITASITKTEKDLGC
ncbi:hypothetical protein HGRIS_000595 [Hohenbuehelia grisea]|uniref:Uncharacterized protein n=1 Tax=Hohenbuehelia grisea TaxID=104357 RepID=A0ABR3JTF6_9AGAR